MRRRRSRAGAHQLLSPKLGTVGAADMRAPNIGGESTDVETDDNRERLWAEADDELLTLDNDFEEISVLIDEMMTKDSERARLLNRAASHLGTHLTHVNKHDDKSGEKECISENQELDVMCWLSLEGVCKDLQALCDEFVP